MSPKRSLSAVLVLSVLLCRAASAQNRPEELPAPFGAMTTRVAQGSPATSEAAPAEPAVAAPAGPILDDYMLYRRPCSCYCPFGGDGPIQAELYLRAGADFPFGGGPLARSLSTGWAIQGGARTMLFEPDLTSAWVVDLGIGNTWDHGNRPDIQIPLSILMPVTDPTTGTTTTQRVNFGTPTKPGVTVRDLNRTFVSAGIGKEWWWDVSAFAPGCKVRWGLDVGGRYGSESAEFNEIRHRTHVIEAVYTAVHADLEVPCGCCIFYYGIRTEYSYTWSEILQEQNLADVQGITLMAEFGVRF
jgi:hypothetical protein